MKNQERKTEQESLQGGKKIHRNKKKTWEKQEEGERERHGEVSILISTISRCSLAAGQIDCSTWLRQTSGKRKQGGLHTARSLPAPQTVAPELPLRHRSTKQRVRKQSRKGRAHLLTVFLPRGLFCLGGFPREQLLHWPLILSNSTLRACIHMTGIHTMLPGLITGSVLNAL